MKQSIQNTEKPLSKLWVLLNQLNFKTHSFPNEILSPYTYPKRKILTIMQQIYLDAHLKGVQGEQVSFLEKTLKEIYPFKNNYNFNDQYWYEDATDQERADREQIKQLVLKAHKEAIVNPNYR